MRLRRLDNRVSLGRQLAFDWTAMTSDTEHNSPSEDGSVARTSPPARPPGRRWRALKNRSDFLRVRAAGLQRPTPGFILQAAPAPNAEAVLRIGFTASKKVGNAVERNRAKRRLRALADAVMPDHANPAFDYVFVGRAGTLRRTFADMRADLRQALKHVCDARNPRRGRTQAAARP